jgi:hypothetical protein
VSLRRTSTVGCALLCAYVLGGHAAAADTELSPKDFAYGAKVLTTGDAAAYRATLPLSVYQKVVRGDLGDLRVFNERGEVVPHRVERPSSQSTVEATPTSLPVFTLRGDPREALDAIRVTIESGSARVNVQAPVTAGTDQSGAPQRPVVSYVLDGRALRVPVASFLLSWPDDAPDFAGRLHVEASEDLGTWRTVVSAAPIANLRSGSARILEQRVEMPGTSARFWRLSWSGSPAPFEITSVIAEPAKDRVDVARATLTAPAQPVPNRPGEFSFDLGAQMPVDRVNLALPERNSIVEVELLSRASPSSQWTPVTRGGFYRLKNASAGAPETADLTNGPLAIEPRSHRYWLARVDVRGGGLGRSAPQLNVGWLPHEVVFLARGMGPFTLAYGSVAVGAASSLNIPANVPVLNATLADAEVLGGDVASRPRMPTFWSKSTLLWTVLGIGVALLAFMAYRLATELKSKPSSGADRDGAQRSGQNAGVE